MARASETYDDDEQLTVYVWRNFRHLLTPLEALADRALLAEAKASHSSPGMAKLFRDKWGARDNPEIADLFADGIDAFREHVRDRMLDECREQIAINRCPKCSRLVVTPAARQCLWCGHDWHGFLD